MIGLKAKLYNKERRKEKIEMKKKILMHEKRDTKVHTWKKLTLVILEILIPWKKTRWILWSWKIDKHDLKKSFSKKEKRRQRALFPIICLIVRHSSVQKSCPIWSSKKEKKKLENGTFLYRKVRFKTKISADKKFLFFIERHLIIS